MKTESLINYNRREIQEFYDKGMINNAQYEAYDFAWANSCYRFSGMTYNWCSLVQDARIEFWKMYHVLPVKIQKVLRPFTVG